MKPDNHPENYISEEILDKNKYLSSENNYLKNQLYHLEESYENFSYLNDKQNKLNNFTDED